MNTTRSYKEDLLKALSDPVEAREYLNAALEDEDIEVFLLALQDVVEAHNTISEVAEASRDEFLEPNLFNKNDAQLDNIRLTLNNLGFKLAIEQNAS